MTLKELAYFTRFCLRAERWSIQFNFSPRLIPKHLPLLILCIIMLLFKLILLQIGGMHLSLFLVWNILNCVFSKLTSSSLSSNKFESCLIICSASVISCSGLPLITKTFVSSANSISLLSLLTAFGM